MPSLVESEFKSLLLSNSSLSPTVPQMTREVNFVPISQEEEPPKDLPEGHGIWQINLTHKIKTK